MRHVRLGYNYRLDEMSAALGLSQLRRLDEILRAAHSVAAMVRSARLAASTRPSRRPVIAAETTRMSWFVYVVRLDPGIDRA